MFIEYNIFSIWVLALFTFAVVGYLFLGKVLLYNPVWPWNHHPSASDSKFRFTVFKEEKNNVKNYPWEYTQ